MDNKKTIRNLIIYLGIPILLIIIISVFFSMQPKEEHATSEIIYLFKDNKVQEYTLDFGTGELEIVKTDNKKVETSVASVSLFLDAIDPYVQAYNDKNEKEPMKFTWKQATDNSFWFNLLPEVILIALFIIVWLYFMRRLSNGLGDAGKSLTFGKAKIKSVSDEKRKTTFADVAGADEEKE